MRGRNYNLCSKLKRMQRFWMYCRQLGTYAIVGEEIVLAQVCAFPIACLANKRGNSTPVIVVTRRFQSLRNGGPGVNEC
jgi:hypothetical protein